MGRARREQVRGLRRGSRARRERRNARRLWWGGRIYDYEVLGGPGERCAKWTVVWPDGREAWYSAPLDLAPEPPSEPYVWPDGWRSLGYVVEDEAAQYLTRQREGE